MKFNFIKRIFNPPEYIEMPSAGIEIGNRFIRYVEYKYTKGELRLSNSGEVLLPPNVFESGKIINKNELVKALVSVKEKLEYDFVKVSVPEEKTYVFNTKIPNIKPKEIRQALEFKLEENVPLKVEEVVFEYETIEKLKDSEGDLFLNVSVIPKQTIEEYINAIFLADMKLISFEVESRMTAMSVVPKWEHGVVMIVNIKDDSTVLSIINDGVVWFTSTISVGNTAILDILEKTSENKGKTLIKIPEKILSFDDSCSPEVFSSMLNIFSIIKDEIGRFNKYWISQESLNKTKPERLNKIILCGRSASIPGFVNHIKQSIDTEVILADVWVNAFKTEEFLPSIKYFDSLDYAVASGLALPIRKNNKNISNFLPDKLRKNVRTEYFFRVASVFLVFVFLVLIISMSFLFYANALSIYKERVISDQLNTTKTSSINYDDGPVKEVKILNEKIKALSFEKTDVSMNQMLQAILSLKNEDVKVSSISIYRDKNQFINVDLQGVSDTREKLIVFVKELKNAGFNGVDLPVSDLVKNVNVDFTLKIISAKK